MAKFIAWQNTLYDSGAQGSTVEEQANVCLALLMEIQCLIRRSWWEAPSMSRKFWIVVGISLKSFRFIIETSSAYRLLWWSVRQESLADGERAIIASWNSVSFLAEQQEAIEEFQEMWLIILSLGIYRRFSLWRGWCKVYQSGFWVRHFEDAEVNGILENEKAPLMPFIYPIRRWLIEVDIKKGCVLNWPKGVRGSCQL